MLGKIRILLGCRLGFGYDLPGNARQEVVLPRSPTVIAINPLHRRRKGHRTSSKHDQHQLHQLIQVFQHQGRTNCKSSRYCSFRTPRHFSHVPQEQRFRTSKSHHYPKQLQHHLRMQPQSYLAQNCGKEPHYVGLNGPNHRFCLQPNPITHQIHLLKPIE